MEIVIDLSEEEISMLESMFDICINDEYDAEFLIHELIKPAM